MTSPERGFYHSIIKQMNKYERLANVFSISVTFLFAQLLADGNWGDERRLKMIAAKIDAIAALRKKGSFPSGGIISKSNKPTEREFGESIFPALKFPPPQ